VFGAAVAGIADQRMAKVREVATDLPVATGFRRDLHQRIALLRIAVDGNGYFRGLQSSPMRDGRLAFAVFTHAGQGIVERATFRRPATTHGQIGLLHTALHELLPQSGGHFGAAPDQQHAAGSAIQAMDQVQPTRQLRAHDIDQVRIAIGNQATAVHRHARRFVDDDDDVVLMQDHGFAFSASAGRQ
jgi:hypothetical protein